MTQQQLGASSLALGCRTSSSELSLSSSYSYNPAFAPAPWLGKRANIPPSPSSLSLGVYSIVISNGRLRRFSSLPLVDGSFRSSSSRGASSRALALASSGHRMCATRSRRRLPVDDRRAPSLATSLVVRFRRRHRRHLHRRRLRRRRFHESRLHRGQSASRILFVRRAVRARDRVPRAQAPFESIRVARARRPRRDAAV